ncbi:signal transduction histidine kinase, LytS [Fibrisoma limi BUZ 3]|uniref:Signal transduction histidine kinase, LytS n=1 Tax=Fibrisoma limi BUZ 3 TaxID=1185876 RepID=I2GNG8_9BACT|nr:histidine kinase [Fibrisoma limi]CCH55446.1 signal transduction histidine kinase, LytS [Fibrisoma limi BUZ 3]
METSKQKIYWFCQIFGWTLLIGVEYLTYLLDFGFQPDTLYLGIANILLGITLTHLYRLMIKRWNWVRLPFFRLAPRVLVSVLVLSMVMTVVNLPADRHLMPELFVNEPAVVLGYLLNFGKTMLTWVLSYTTYHYFEQSRNAEIERILLKTSIRETEAKVLRSQLNPHFVFNALNSIRALVYENPIKAQQGITQLSNLLRNSLLADRRKTVELREEIKTVEDYLALEQVRYEDRLKSRIDLDARTLYWQVPPMMLQTLVENAIKHGVSKAVGGGFVEVRSTVIIRDDASGGSRSNNTDQLHIIIRNTGILGDKEASGGFGLKNTSQRLDLLYGPEASFDIVQEDDNVVRADIIIPIQSDTIFRKTADQSLSQ